LDEAQLVSSLKEIVDRIRSEEDPFELNQYRRLFRKGVPLTLRSYFAAYLLKQLCMGRNPGRFPSLAPHRGVPTAGSPKAGPPKVADAKVGRLKVAGVIVTRLGRPKDGNPKVVDGKVGRTKVADAKKAMDAKVGRPKVARVKSVPLDRRNRASPVNRASPANPRRLPRRRRNHPLLQHRPEPSGLSPRSGGPDRAERRHRPRSHRRRSRPR
jgi:hypothetical protein